MIRLATRRSPLALIQAEEVARALRVARPGDDVVLVPLATRGDSVPEDQSIAASGLVNAFTAEIDLAVADRRADAGVHSLKDLGTKLAGGLMLAAALPRAPVEDVLVAPRASGLAGLPAGARVGTGSPRRRAMLLRARPDVACVPLRGNIQTRLARVEAGAVDAAILARAGLVRLGMTGVITEILGVDGFLPAAGQGLIGVVCREDDAATAAALAAINDAGGLAAGVAERSVMAALGAGCHAPVGVLAAVSGADRLLLRCRILAHDGTGEVAGERAGGLSDAERMGAALAEAMLARGAGRYLA